tara:strand:- start:456 stop:845 length:390 start_codon:yes stop_codon:yes gene_type:complete
MKLFLKLILLTTFLVLISCSSQDNILKVHNEIVKIESETIEEYNNQSTIYAQSAAIKLAVSKLEQLDTNGLPQDYKNAILGVKEAWEGWQRALDQANIEKADVFNDLSQERIENLNKVAESNGLIIQRP